MKLGDLPPAPTLENRPFVVGLWVIANKVSPNYTPIIYSAHRSGYRRRFIRHARRVVFQLAEVAVPQTLFQGVLERIGRLCPAPA